MEEAVAQFAAAGSETRGAIYTRPEIAEFMLDLGGYRPQRALPSIRLLEPSFGAGDFLFPAVRRLLESWHARAQDGGVAALASAIRAVELHTPTFLGTKEELRTLLRSEGFAAPEIQTLLSAWLKNDDFLLTDLEGPFHLIVGNPPYVRQELIPSALMAAYRSRFTTIYDRADLYVPFIERGLKSLAPQGSLVYICADRWMKNRYGGPLRELVAKGYCVKAYVDMVGTQAFLSEVSAYPAITRIDRDTAGTARAAYSPNIETETLARLAELLVSAEPLPADSLVSELPCIAQSAAPWILETSDELHLLRRLEQNYPTLEEAGCKVGIGVATGADKAFIGPFASLDVEADRKLPLATTKDLIGSATTGRVEWQGQGVINPFAPDGRLVDLNRYPRLRAYLEARKDQIAKRHVALKSAGNWYRTIDRIYPELCQQPKLLIPDIKGEAHVVYEEGFLYPHHNLYYVTSEVWDLQVLRAILLSGIARLFVAHYSTKMRGGYLRFQAQYLRRIRVPHWADVSPEMRSEVLTALGKNDTNAINQAVAHLYGLTEEEGKALFRDDGGGEGDGDDR